MVLNRVRIINGLTYNFQHYRYFDIHRFLTCFIITYSSSLLPPFDKSLLSLLSAALYNIVKVNYSRVHWRENSPEMFETFDLCRYWNKARSRPRFWIRKYIIDRKFLGDTVKMASEVTSVYRLSVLDTERVRT